MNTLLSIKQKMTKILLALLALSQLAGCYSEGKSVADSSVTDNTDAGLTGNIATFTASIKLSWTAPVERENTQPISMSEIAGFHVYYGTETGNYVQSIEVNDAYIDEIFLDDLNAADTYYIVVTTIDVDGLESAYSDEIILNV